MNVFQKKWNPVLLLFSISGMTFAENQFPINHWDVDGQHGQVHVKGILTESPCRIAMHSMYQDIEISDLKTADFPSIHSMGNEYPFYIELLDCLATPVNMLDPYSGNMTWSNDQPGFSIRFVTTKSENMSKYISIRGIEGLGLVLKDKQGNTITLGEYTKPKLVPQRQSILTYSVIPVRTSMNMTPGKFSSVISFQLNYD
ncbi:MAG: fimbrial protein [Providencia rettgeri]